MRVLPFSMLGRLLVAEFLPSVLLESLPSRPFIFVIATGFTTGGRSTGLSSTLMGFLAIRLGPVLFLLPTHSSCTHFAIANRKGTHEWLQHMLFRLEHVKSNRYSTLTRILCV